MRPKQILIFAAALSLAGPLDPARAGVGDVTITSPWTLATVSSAKVAGAFLTISNKGRESDRLISVTTDAARSVEIHEMQMVNGVMMMRDHNPGITVKANGMVVLKPFAHHLMLIDLKAPLTAGGRIKARLLFEKAGPMDVEFPIEPIGSNGPAAAARHHH